ncbi:MAG: hypothetical protein O6837_09950 [Deltaproteobacteria bacterium]|jgi:hypothetical protein|nr:hypothetical protein [candidate division NC10 bacterium]MCZ6548421.1 hypothetical protein [Deltaproteobacteria bacterium]MCZ6563152.1 hypothetical protein [Deltaproteobacteria bacterium]
MEEYQYLIWLLILLLIWGIPALFQWLQKRGQTSVAAPEGEDPARLSGVEEAPPEYALPQALKKARESEMPARPPLPVRPEVREAQLEEWMEQPVEVPAVERATEIPKARPSGPSWFRDAGDVKRAVIWAEVLRRPVPRRPRRRHPRNRAGMV